MNFPKEFVFGSATAAYQCEGSTRSHGKGKVAWDDYYDQMGLFQADPASDFYHRYDEDIALCAAFGMTGIRISIAWSRIFPEGRGALNPEGVQYYHDVFASCHRHGVEPYVTLHHFDTPDALHKQGDFLNRETIAAYVAYATFCFQEYQKDVKYWFTFNEVWPIATNQYIEGTFPPCVKYDISKALASMHGMMYAHALAVKAYKEAGYQGEIGVIHSLETKYPLTDASGDLQAARRDDALANRFLLDATFLGCYQEETLALIQEICDANEGHFEVDEKDFIVMKEAAAMLDYLGVNYYQSSFVRAYEGDNQITHNGTGDKGTKTFKLKGVGERVLRADIPTTDWDWVIYPQGLYDMLKRIKDDYVQARQIYITENGLGYKDEIDAHGIIFDEPRIDYIRGHLKYIEKAIQDGIPVKGYFVWSLMDMFSWSNGYNKRYGLIYVDYETQKRYPKASAYWYKNVIAKRELDL